MRTTRTRAVGAMAVAAALIAGAVSYGEAQAAVGPDTSALRTAVTVAGIKAHLQAFQTIANTHDGNREASSDGYKASVDYVQAQLGADYLVTTQDFDYPFFEDTEIPELVVDGTPYVDGGSSPDPGDFATMTFSGDGDLTDVPIVAVDVNSTTSGCEAADFAAFPPDAIALIRRGTCTFQEKADNALAADAAAVIIFNAGDSTADDRVDMFFGTLDGWDQFAIPVLSASLEVGLEIRDGLPSTADLFVDSFAETRQSTNVFAQTKTGRTDRVVVVGAHLDSVEEGPGINDNGSGSATILETALQMAALDIEPTNAVRFAFWGAEEAGLIGSEYYVTHLTARDRKNIALNLNFDMLASPNYVRFVYDGDGSNGVAGPNGSGVIEKVFLDYFASQELETEPTDFDGRSDYGPFIAAGIPAGGLFSGAEGIKTAEEAASDAGGTAGAPYDPCYHAECDTIANINDDALDELGDAAVHAILTFAQTTSAVNGTGKASSKATPMTFRGDSALK